MRFPHTVQRFVASSWGHTEGPLWRCSHAFPPPSKAPRGLIGSSTEGPSGGVRMFFHRPI
eukprot:9413054-Pyramimonas_sp.AAC.1